MGFRPGFRRTLHSENGWQTTKTSKKHEVRAPKRSETHANEVKSAIFSFDGLRVITASMDGTARAAWRRYRSHSPVLEVWNVDPGGCLQVLQGHAKALTVGDLRPIAGAGSQ